MQLAGQMHDSISVYVIKRDSALDILSALDADLLRIVLTISFQTALEDAQLITLAEPVRHHVETRYHKDTRVRRWKTLQIRIWTFRGGLSGGISLRRMASIQMILQPRFAGFRTGHVLALLLGCSCIGIPLPFLA